MLVLLNNGEVKKYYDDMVFLGLPDDNIVYYYRKFTCIYYNVKTKKYIGDYKCEYKIKHFIKIKSKLTKV